MAVRFNSRQESGTSAEWTPVGETILQMATNDSFLGICTVQTKLDTNAPWINVAKLDSMVPLRIVKLPILRINLINNLGKRDVSVYDYV